MTPYLVALQVYASEPCARSLAEDIELHARFGYVHSTPEVFAMGRRVWSHWPHERLSQPWEVAADGDCWWIWLLAGDVRQAIGYIPEPLPWIGYERLNSPRVMPAAKFLRMLAK
jgi:hypothetical protein